jgi:hypothetical protein
MLFIHAVKLVNPSQISQFNEVLLSVTALSVDTLFFRLAQLRSYFLMDFGLKQD